MKYYKLIYDYENDNNYINCNIADFTNMNTDEVSNGVLIKDWSLVIFQYNSVEGNIMSDYIANVYRWLIVSSNFCTVMEESAFNVHIQYLPVKLIDMFSGVVSETYKIANILDVVDALDLEHSQYDVFELEDETVISFEKYALKMDEIKDLDIFRLKNDTIPIFVSDRMKRRIEENGLLGFAFLEVVIY